MASAERPVLMLRSAHHRALPFWDPSRASRLLKVAAWLVGIALLVVGLERIGVDVSGWFSNLRDALTAGSVGYQLVGFSAQTVQTTLTALAWYFILRAGFPDARVEVTHAGESHLGWFIFINSVPWVIWAVPPDSANTDDIWPAWVTGIRGVLLIAHWWRVYQAPEEGPTES